ncbi:MAG: MFS transporter, partial [Nitrospinota bacterium]
GGRAERPGGGREAPRDAEREARDVSAHVPPREALRTPAFWLLSGTYLACGFTDFLLFFHFPIFAIGLGVPDQTAANILGLTAGVSIAGTVAFAALSDRAGRPLPLAAVYAIRAVGFLVLVWSRSPGPLYVFMGLYGFVLFASNPITSAATRELYGPRSFGTLYGYLIFVHYVGSFFGPLAGGMAYDRWGRYDEAFLLGALLLVGAAACALAIRGRMPTGRKTGPEAAGERA